MSAAAAIGLAAGGLQTLAYLIYAAQLLRAETRPNGMTWVMWTFGTFVFLAVELHLGVPASVLALPVVCLLCSLGIAAYAFARGVWLRPARQDWAAFGLDASILAGYAGQTALGAPAGAGQAFVALAGASVLTSSWPILRTTFLHPGNERPLAWFVWSAAYGLLALAVMLEGLAWPFLVYPAASLALNLLIGLLALDSAESLRRKDGRDGAGARAG